MVESRWLRWIGPGVVALGAVGADRVHDARRRARARGRRAPAPDAPATGRGGSRPARGRDRRTARRRRGSGSTRCSTAMARWPGSACRSARRRRGRADAATLPPSRSRPARSAGIVLVGADDGARRGSTLLDVARRLRLVARPTSATSSGARRSTRPGRDVYEIRVDRADPRRPRDLAPAARRRGRGRRASSPPIAPTARFGRDLLDRVHLGRSPVTGSRSSPAARSPAGRRIARPATAVAVALARRPGSRAARRLRRRRGRDLRGVPRAPLPDRRDGSRDRRRSRSLDRCGRAAASQPPTHGPRARGPRGDRAVTARIVALDGHGDGRRDLGPIAAGLRSAGAARSAQQPRRAAGRLGPARPGRPPAGRPSVTPADPPPRPGRRDRPARRGDPMTPNDPERPPRRRRGAGRSPPCCSALALPAAGRRRARAGPVARRRSVRPEPGARFRWRSGAEPTAAIKTAINAAAADATATQGSKAATFAYDTAGANPIGYGAGRDVRGERARLLHADAPDGFTMWLREQGHVFDWGTLKWCQAYAARRTAATTPRRSRSTSSATSRASTTTSTTPTIATTTTPSSRRSRGRSRRRGWNRHTFGRCDVATLQRRVRRAVDRPRSTRPASTVDPVLTLAASPDVGRRPAARRR